MDFVEAAKDMKPLIHDHKKQWALKDDTKKSTALTSDNLFLGLWNAGAPIMPSTKR